MESSPEEGELANRVFMDMELDAVIPDVESDYRGLQMTRGGCRLASSMLQIRGWNAYEVNVPRGATTPFAPVADVEVVSP